MKDIPSIDDFRGVFLNYTRNVFHLLPKVPKPNILDVGCGTGVATLEIARLTDGEILGIDIDQTALNELNEKIKNEEFSSQINIKMASLLDLGLDQERFDIIWAEGVIHIIGFEVGLKACYNLLKSGGFLVLAEAVKGMDQNIALAEKIGFELYNQINWKKGSWWTKFYSKLQITLKKLREEGVPSELYQDLINHEEEITMVKNNVEASDCAHYIFKKI